MKISIIGAAGFIGTNLAMALLEKNQGYKIHLIDSNILFFDDFPEKENSSISLKEIDYVNIQQINDELKGTDILFHLVSTTNPTCSNEHISADITDNIMISVNILEACRHNNIKRIVFISSGGTVYGVAKCPISEENETNPINTYGIQKLTIEKLLYLYNYMHGLDYRIVRLSNPYGPYQRPNGKLGAITTFTYRALRDEQINVYGDGSVVRDFIYIDDAISAILNIGFCDCINKVYNIGGGKGTSINEILSVITRILGKKMNVTYSASRSVDLQENYLDTSRYVCEFGKIENVDLEEGIRRTCSFLEKHCD